MTALDIFEIETPLKKTRPSSSASMFNRKYKWIAPLLLGLFLAATLFYLIEAEAIKVGFLAEDAVTVKYTSSDGESGIVSAYTVVKKKTLPSSDGGSGILSTSTVGKKKMPVLSPTTEPQNPLLSFPKILLAFQQKRQEWFDQLEKDYGKETFKKLLLDHGRTAIRPPNEDSAIRPPAKEGVPLYSSNRMHRKMMIKLLEAQKAVLYHRSSEMGFTNAHEFPKFIWASGGHSTTAGHGNMWRESYTKVMERGVQDIFAACGIDLVARNHAMGSSYSGPETAMCAKEVFGTDIDVLLWDTAMTDGRDYWRMVMYFLRAGTLAQQPAAVAFNVNEGPKGGRSRAVQAVEDTGMPTFQLDHSEDRAINGAIPDTFGLSDAEIAEMPKFVRNFKCGNQLEKGDPGCEASKWNLTVCPDRPFKTSWHPGWKVNALSGNTLGVWLTNIMGDALKELAAERPDPAFLDELRALEMADRKVFMSRELPMKILEELKLPDDVDPEMFYRGSNICHTARLPAEIRHLGILTESSLVGEDSYDKGIGLKTARNSTREDKSMQLVYTEKARQNCPIPLEKDYKDFFFVAETHGWSQLTLPNNAEVKAYGVGVSEPLRGVIAVCFAYCRRDQCGVSNLRRNETQAGMAEMEVNGLKVTTLTEFSEDCSFLRNVDGHVWKPNSGGRFQIRAKVNTEKSHVRFSSFVIW